MRSEARRLALFAVACSCFAGLLVAPAPPAQATLVFTGLGDLPGGFHLSQAWGVSGDGSTVVGQSESEVGPVAYVWSDGVMTDLGEGGRYLDAFAASSDGEILVGSDGTRWDRLQPSELSDPEAGLYFGPAFAVTPDGSAVVGIGGHPELHAEEAFLWRNGMITRLGDLEGGGFSSRALDISHDGATVVGRGRSEQFFREAFRWTEAEGMVGLGDFPGGTEQSGARGVSADGSVIVGYGFTPDGTQAFRWVDGVMTGLGATPGRVRSSAEDVSADGRVIVGNSWRSPRTDTEAFIWIEGRGILSLQDLLTSTYGLDLEGWTLRVAHAVSDDGFTIVGDGINPDGDLEAWIATIPEPTTALLLAGGLVGLALRRRLSA